MANEKLAIISVRSVWHVVVKIEEIQDNLFTRGNVLHLLRHIVSLIFGRLII